MKILGSVFLLLPLGLFSQSDKSSSLELKMFNHAQVVVSIDGKTFDACSKFTMDEIEAGDHDLKVYQPKQYVNPLDQSVSERLVPVYSGEIFIADSKCTSCIINEYHQKEVSIQK